MISYVHKILFQVNKGDFKNTCYKSSTDLIGFCTTVYRTMLPNMAASNHMLLSLL